MYCVQTVKDPHQVPNASSNQILQARASCTGPTKVKLLRTCWMPTDTGDSLTPDQLCTCVNTPEEKARIESTHAPVTQRTTIYDALLLHLLHPFFHPGAIDPWWHLPVVTRNCGKGAWSTCDLHRKKNRMRHLLHDFRQWYMSDQAAGHVTSTIADLNSDVKGTSLRNT